MPGLLTSKTDERDKAFRKPLAAELTFPDPMREFEAVDGDRGAPKALQSKHWTQTKFDRSMVCSIRLLSAMCKPDTPIRV
jgi:hypothetical protein